MIYQSFNGYGEAPPGAIWPSQTPRQERAVGIGGILLLIGGLALADYLYKRFEPKRARA